MRCIIFVLLATLTSCNGVLSWGPQRLTVDSQEGSK